MGLVLAHVRPQVGASPDRQQLACGPQDGVGDAIIYLLRRALSHMDKADSTVGNMLFGL